MARDGRVVLAAMSVALGLLGTTAPGATIMFIGGTTGNGELTTSTNWSPVTANPIPTVQANAPDIVFGADAGTTSTWTTAAGGWYINRIEFSAPNNFVMANSPGGNVYITSFTDLTQPMIQTSAAHVYGMPGHYATAGARYQLYPGSTLNINGSMANDTDLDVRRSTTTGPGATINFKQMNAYTFKRLSLGEGVTASFVGSDYPPIIQGLSGTGTVQGTGNRPLTISSVNYGFAGTVRGGGGTQYIYFEQSGAGTSTATFTGGRWLADTAHIKGMVNVRLQDAEMANSSSTIRFGFHTGTNSTNGAVANTLTAAGTDLKPGTDGSSKIMEVVGNVSFDKYNDANSVLYIDITGAGAVAGTDYDQLYVRRTTGTGTPGGSISSVGSSNPLANLNLVIDIAQTISNADLTGDVLTILRTDMAGFSFAGSEFANVSFANGGSADVNYNSNGTITLSSIVVPEPGAVALTAGTLLVLAGRRRRR